MARAWWALTGFLSWLLGPSSAVAQERPYDWGWGMHPMWGVWGTGMMLMMLVFWGAAIVGVVMAIRRLAGPGERSRSDRAVDLLRERYAQGEINKDEFEAKQRDLR